MANHPNRSQTAIKGRIGYDYSPGAYDLRVRCLKHGDARRGNPIFAGEEWGAHDFPACEVCGKVLEELELVS